MKIKKSVILLSLGLSVVFMGLAIAIPAMFGNEINYMGIEDTLYVHNFSANTTDIIPGTTFVVDIQQRNTTRNNIQINYSDISSWIFFNNSISGEFFINATMDNQTGFFVIPIKATWVGGTGGIDYNFTINATNDAPDFTLAPSYPREINDTVNYYFFNLTGTDEEMQYPLEYNLSFRECEPAAWSTRKESGDCNLTYNITIMNNTTSFFNFTGLTDNDVGIYNLTICTKDNVNATTPPEYRDANYDENKTTCKNTTLNIERTLSVNVTDCTNKTLQENQEFSCNITVKTKGQADNLTATSNAAYRNYIAAPHNTTWFFETNVSQSVEFMQTYLINITPSKLEIGNWSINFSVNDSSTREIVTEPIYVYVNRTQNANPTAEIIPIPNNDTSIDKPTEIRINVYDDDLLIGDKLEGFNETIYFDIGFYNTSNNEKINTLDYQLPNSIISSTNRTEATLSFTPNLTHIGNYTLNVTVHDKGIGNVNSTDTKLYNFTILSRNFPVWNQTNYIFNISVNSTRSSTSNLSINLSEYASDMDNLTLSFQNYSTFVGFSINSEGIVNITPYKKSVGYHKIIISASNSYFANNTTFIFNITNINSPPIIKSIQGTNLTSSTAPEIDNNAIINSTESSSVIIQLIIEDDDLDISPEYYNETLIIETQTNNSSGIDTNLFEFISWPKCDRCNTTTQRRGFIASFTPQKNQAGTYNVTIIVNDSQNITTTRNFTYNLAQINNPPVIDIITNQSTSRDTQFYYRINATDIEDGNSTSEGNLTFKYEFLNCSEILANTSLNNKTGEIMINFSSGGICVLNITVTDMGIMGEQNLTGSKILGIYVYDSPIINMSNTKYSTYENEPINITFKGNHSVQNNLRYTIYINEIQFETFFFYGNNTEKNITYTPNYTQETHETPLNFTIIASNEFYSSQAEAELNVSHTNHPLEQIDNIDTPLTGSNHYDMDLTKYFLDYDAIDPYYNQTIGFVVNTISGGNGISVIVTNWSNNESPTINFSTTTTSSGNYSITAYEYNETNPLQSIRNLTTNNFTLILDIATQIITNPTSGSSSSGSGEVNTIKILAASETAINRKGEIVFPFEIINTGKSTLNQINLSTIILTEISKEINATIKNLTISSLKPGERISNSILISVNTQKEGKYNLFLYANVTRPKIHDWAQISLNIIKSNEDEAEKMVIFTEKLIIENPECLELNEIFKEAKKSLEAGDYEKSLKETETIIESCKKAISRNSQIRNDVIEENYMNYLVGLIIVLAVIMIYFLYKRARFKNKYLVEKQ